MVMIELLHKLTTSNSILRTMNISLQALQPLMPKHYHTVILFLRLNISSCIQFSDQCGNFRGMKFLKKA